MFPVVFHVATLMPNRDSDPNCNAKKLHIGNDYVTIVYNDSGQEHRIGSIKVGVHWTSQCRLLGHRQYQGGCEHDTLAISIIKLGVSGISQCRLLGHKQH